VQVTAEQKLLLEDGVDVRVAVEDRKPYPPGDLAIWIFILAELPSISCT
jgi:hypothetical protein